MPSPLLNSKLIYLVCQLLIPLDMNKYTKETLGATMSEAAFYDFFRKIQLRSDDGITLRAELEADSVKDILTIHANYNLTNKYISIIKNNYQTK